MSTYGLDTAQLRLMIVRPVLTRLGLYSLAAENLVTGTAMVESKLKYLTQLGRGPARGLWQMEGATHFDIHTNYLKFRPQLLKLVMLYAAPLNSDIPDPDIMAGNLYYACAMCRVDYLRAPEALPAPTDAAGMAALHKLRYNSAGGKTDITESIKDFQQAVLESSV